MRFLVCDTFGHLSDTNSSDNTKPSSGSSSVPKTFSLILFISIFGSVCLDVSLDIQPLSTKIKISELSILRGVRTLYPAMPLLITLSTSICLELSQVPLIKTLSHFLEFSEKADASFFKLFSNSEMIFAFACPLSICHIPKAKIQMQKK